MIARLVGLAYPLMFLAAMVVVAVLLLAEARRLRRADARRAELLARPHDNRPPTEAEIAAAWAWALHDTNRKDRT